MKVKKPDNLETEDIIFSMEEPLEKGSMMAMRSASRLALFMMRVWRGLAHWSGVRGHQSEKDKQVNY